MLFKKLALVVAVAGVLSGCMETLGNSQLAGVGVKALQAASLSDQEVVTLSNQSCAQMDQQNKVAPAGNAYQQRLQRVAATVSKNLNGQKPDFKVYLVQDVNAWAMANGCIRFYAGLMDKMNDDELRGVIAHEMGHVELGHSKRAMQTAYAISIAREAAAVSGNQMLSALSGSQLGALTEQLLNAQFSQSQESAADDYAYDLLKARQQNTRGLVTAFEKLAALDGGQSSLMSTHPGSSERARRMQARIDADQKS